MRILHLRGLALFVLFALALSAVLEAQRQRRKRQLPPPLKVMIPFEAAWEGMLETLREDIKLDVAGKDQVTGEIISEFHPYIDGPLTESHIAKIGVPIRLRDATWVKARYRYEIQIILIGAREAVVIADANIQALKREFLGEESWVDIQSKGQLETRLLTAYGQRLFGSDFNLAEPKKGFWERDPSYVPRPEDRVPEIAVPERPPQ